MRAHGGIAWFPVFNSENKIEWRANSQYQTSELICKTPNDYSALGIEAGKSIYEIFEKDPDTFLYVPSPQLREDVWKNFIP